MGLSFRLPRPAEDARHDADASRRGRVWHSYAPGPGAYEWCRV